MKIKAKILLLTTSTVTLLLILILGLNQFVFEEYYLRIKEKNLIEVANQITNPNSYINFTELEEKNNIRIYLIDREALENFGLNISEEEMNRVLRDSEITYKTTIENQVTSKSLLLLAKYNEDIFLVILSPFSFVAETLEIINGFYLRIVLGVFVLGGLLSLGLAKILSKQILAMGEVAKKVANLEFKEKFKVNSSDEVGELAKNLNKMSENLKLTIGTLREDIELKKEKERRDKEFITSISHELKTPTTVIYNYAEGLKEKMAKTKEIQEEYVDCILEETNNLNNLINAILYLSGIEKGQKGKVIKEFSIKEIIEEEVIRLKEIFPKKKFNIKYKESIFYGNSQDFRIIIKNLMDNAGKYSESDEIKIKVDKNYLQIKNKTSIEEDELINLWIPFYKVDKAREKNSGIGLGLSIVRNLLSVQKFNCESYKEKEEIVFEIKKEGY